MNMLTETYPITGIPLVPGRPLPTRQEITAWYNNDDNKHQVSLFMQSLAQFKAMPIEERFPTSKLLVCLANSQSCLCVT